MMRFDTQQQRSYCGNDLDARLLAISGPARRFDRPSGGTEEFLDAGPQALAVGVLRQKARWQNPRYVFGGVGEPPSIILQILKNLHLSIIVAAVYCVTPRSYKQANALAPTYEPTGTACPPPKVWSLLAAST
jgi:hypothetical protein